MENPRLGLILLRADRSGWYEPQQVDDDINADTAEMIDILARDLVIEGMWVVDTPESLQSCIDALHETVLDLVVVAFQTLAEDGLLVSLLPAVSEWPLVLWCYLPRATSAASHMPRPVEGGQILLNSGPVGTFAALGTLHNLGTPFLFTYGAPDDPRFLRDLRVAGKAARVRQMLRAATIGVIPSPAGMMQCTFVDEARLKEELGPQVLRIPVEDYRRYLEAVEGKNIKLYLEVLRKRFAVKGVPPETLRWAARAMLGLSSLAWDHHLDVLGLYVNSPELLQMVKMRPGLYPALLAPEQALFQPEPDLGAAVANLVLHWFTGSPTMLMEMWFWDGPKNQVVGGHIGPQNPEMAREGSAWVSPDLYFFRLQGSEGAQIQFIARPGRVTLFQLRCTPRGWQAVAASGMCLESLPWTETCPHAVVRLDMHIDQFIKRVAAVGITQHWLMAYGSVLPEIEAFCQMANIPLELAVD